MDIPYKGIIAPAATAVGFTLALLIVRSVAFRILHAWAKRTETKLDDIIIATSQGKIARFHEGEIRAMGRDAAGVIGIRLAREGDYVVGMSVVQQDTDLLVLTETGYGKRVPLGEFRPMHRGS